MSDSEQLLVGIVMVAGIVGILLPVLPGLLLVWAAGLWWTIADGGGATRWTVLAVLTLLLVALHLGGVGTTYKWGTRARAGGWRRR